jgi:hypothetical protein
MLSQSADPELNHDDLMFLAADITEYNRLKISGADPDLMAAKFESIESTIEKLAYDFGLFEKNYQQWIQQLKSKGMKISLLPT